MMVAPLNIVHAADQNDEQVDLPLNRLGQNTQQETQNNNVNLFQTSQIGDLGKQQRAVVNSRTVHLFQQKSTKITLYNDHNLFKKNSNAGQVNYTQAQTSQAHQVHYYLWLTIIVTLIGLLISWKMVNKHE